MMSGWRQEGLDRDEIELWVVGYSGQERLVPGFAAGSDAACFVDSPEAGAFESFQAVIDDLLLMDPHGAVRYEVNLIDSPLSDEESRGRLDGEVRSLLSQ